MKLIKQIRLEPWIDPHGFKMLGDVRLMTGERACLGDDPMFQRLFRPIANLVVNEIILNLREFTDWEPQS